MEKSKPAEVRTDPQRFWEHEIWFGWCLGWSSASSPYSGSFSGSQLVGVVPELEAVGKVRTLAFSP